MLIVGLSQIIRIIPLMGGGVVVDHPDLIQVRLGVPQGLGVKVLNAFL